MTNPSGECHPLVTRVMSGSIKVEGSDLTPDCGWQIPRQPERPATARRCALAAQPGDSQQFSQLGDVQVEGVIHLRAVRETAPVKVIAQDGKTRRDEVGYSGIVDVIGDREAVHEDNERVSRIAGEFVMGHTGGQRSEITIKPRARFRRERPIFPRRIRDMRAEWRARQLLKGSTPIRLFFAIVTSPLLLQLYIAHPDYMPERIHLLINHLSNAL